MSISTGIITVLQATTAIISVCYNFRAALKEDSWSLTQVVAELKDLRSILEIIEELVQKANSGSSFRSDGMFEMLGSLKDGPLVVCHQEFDTLEKTIMASSYATLKGKKRRAALQAVKW